MSDPEPRPPLTAAQRSELDAALAAAAGISPRHRAHAAIEHLLHRSDPQAMLTLGVLAQEGARLEAAGEGLDSEKRDAEADARLNALATQDRGARTPTALNEYVRLAEVALRAYLGRRRGQKSAIPHAAPRPNPRRTAL